MLPTKTRLRQLAADAGFEVEQSHWFGQSYAKTLATWRHQVESVHTEITAQGFDDRFLRMWRYYLVYCETGFTFGSTDVGLMKLIKRS